MAKVKGRVKKVEPRKTTQTKDVTNDELSSFVNSLIEQNAELQDKLERMESLVQKTKEKAKAQTEKINTRAEERAERIIAKARQNARKHAEEIISEAEEEASKLIVAAQMIAEEEALPVRQEAEQLPTPSSEVAGTLIERSLNATGNEDVPKEESPATPQESTIGFSITFPRTTEQLLKIPTRLKNLLKSRSWS